MLKENKEVKAMELSERKQKILKAIVDLYIRQRRAGRLQDDRRAAGHELLLCDHPQQKWPS